MPSVRRSVLTLLSLFLLSACGGSDGPTGPQSISVTVTPGTATLASIGETVTLAANARDDGGAAVTATVTWSSSDESVATVAPTGEVTAVGLGTATITASAVADGLTASGTASITVAQAPATITLSPVTFEIGPGGNVTIEAVVRDAGGTVIAVPSIVWTTSDATVATVTESTPTRGVVVGVAAGTATITATAGSASATATITVVLQNVVFDADQTIGGTLSVDSATVLAGVTLTLLDDLVLNANALTIDGTIEGNCREVLVNVAGDFAHTGTLDNQCTGGNAGDAADVTILAEGGIAASGELTSSGAIIVSNAGIDGNGAPSAAEAFAMGQGSPFAAPGDGPLDCVYEGFLAQVNPAVAGPGQDGEGVAFFCSGAALFVGGNQIAAQDGGDGTDGAAGPVSTAMDGGDGGDVRIIVLNGDALFQDNTIGGGEGTAVSAGFGGDGGEADADGAGTGGDATATAGDGGDGGWFFLDVRNGAAEFEALGALRVAFGDGGWGGDADAAATDGADAGAAPAEDGGDATAEAGDGGDGGQWGLTVVSGGITNVQQEGANGGAGGSATARGGNGGDGNTAFPDGADGGFMDAEGGDGGDSGGAPGTPGQGVFGFGGDGGDMDIMDGMGGAGAPMCPVGTGGNGGAGGDGAGNEGSGGDGFTDGTDGTGTIADDTGDGGPGGDGTTPGDGGDGGTDNTGVPANPDAFEDGPPGGGCPPIGGMVNVNVSVPSGGDPGGHEPFNRIAATVTKLTVTIEGANIVIEGDGNWVAVSGTYDETTGGFIATGTGAAGSGITAGHSFEGTVTVVDGVVTSISGTYISGAGGEYPGGDPTVYDVGPA